MKRFQCPALLVLAIGLCFCIGCGPNNSATTDEKTNQPGSSQWNQTNVPSSNEVIETVEGPMNATDYQRAKDAALAYAEKLDEERMHHPELFTNPPPSEWPFPNYPAGPGNPLPPYVNFYSMNDRYPAYLLCEYDVDESNYSQGNEPKWFETALEQIRQAGPKKFPPVVKWVAIIIINRSGWNGADTFEQAHKVGAIFKASDVFNPSFDLSQLVAHADMDRHPFKYDTTQPTPGDQQRWLIVEQDAATNGANAGPK